MLENYKEILFEKDQINEGEKTLQECITALTSQYETLFLVFSSFFFCHLVFFLLLLFFFILFVFLYFGLEFILIKSLKSQ